MNYLYAVLLGLVQGITEFLPISSSGHLILLPRIFNVADQGLAVDAVLHLVTALAIIIYFRRDIWLIVRGWKRDDTWKKIVIGSIPAALLGVLLQDFVDQTLRSPWVVVTMLVTVAGVMWWVDTNYSEVKMVTTVDSVPENSLRGVGWFEAMLIGVVQAVALIPGSSRSGVTISAGMWRHIPRATAAKFSFLLGVPITLGAGLLELRHLVGQSGVDWGFLGVAGTVTFISAMISIHWLLKFLQRGGLRPFVIYRVILALVVAIFLLVSN